MKSDAKPERDKTEDTLEPQTETAEQPPTQKRPTGFSSKGSYTPPSSGNPFGDN